MLTKERRIHLATEKSPKPRLGQRSFNSLNSHLRGNFPLQNVRLSYLVSGSLLNLPCSQCLLTQERAANGLLIRKRVISGQGQSAAQVCVSLYPGCLSQHRPPLLEPPPVKQRPGLQKTCFQSSHFVRNKVQIPHWVCISRGTSRFERRGSCDSRRTKRACGHSNALDFHRPCHEGPG